MFHPSFHLSLAVLVHYRSIHMFSLGVWSPQIPYGVCRLRKYLGNPYGALTCRIPGYHGLWPPIPRCSAISLQSNVGLLQPRDKSRFRLLPFRSSLTQGISFDLFSCAYLDISVQRVPDHNTRLWTLWYNPEWVSPFGHRRIGAS